ncbi:MAG: ACT domain-containing protein [Clostridia bacterium]|nr:ACT domain-containing protein [Clostridia bacterium]
MDQNQSAKVSLWVIPEPLTVCRMHSLAGFSFEESFYFLGKTEEEISLVCPTAKVPVSGVEKREDGWRALKIEGELDFSLVGILAGLAGILADHGISIFAVSTFNTDYVLVKETCLRKATEVLTQSGYIVTDTFRSNT